MVSLYNVYNYKAVKIEKTHNIYPNLGCLEYFLVFTVEYRII